MPLLNDPTARDEDYCALRDDHQLRAQRDALEQLWDFFDGSRLSEQGSRERCKRSLHTVFWEMLVAEALVEADLGPSRPRGEGMPDFVFEKDGQRCWVEAVTAGRGDGENQLPDWRLDDRPLPAIDLAVLRMTQALNTKRDQHARMLARGSVSPNDRYVIALNTGKLRPFVYDPGYPPFFTRAVLPIGPLIVRIDRATGRFVGFRVELEPELRNANDAPVARHGFLSDDWMFCSALFHSPATALSVPGADESGMAVLRNPRASNPLSLEGWEGRWALHDVAVHGNTSFDIVRQDRLI